MIVHKTFDRLTKLDLTLPSAKSVEAGFGLKNVEKSVQIECLLIAVSKMCTQWRCTLLEDQGDDALVIKFIDEDEEEEELRQVQRSAVTSRSILLMLQMGLLMLQILLLLLLLLILLVLLLMVVLLLVLMLVWS